MQFQGTLLAVVPSRYIADNGNDGALCTSDLRLWHFGIGLHRASRCSAGTRISHLLNADGSMTLNMTLPEMALKLPIAESASLPTSVSSPPA